jgi:hypothetical protein
MIFLTPFLCISREEGINSRQPGNEGELSLRPYSFPKENTMKEEEEEQQI